MKTVTLIFISIGLLTLSSCNQKTDIKAMLESSGTRSAIFDAITDNQEYMTEFMDSMQVNDHAMQMMQGNQKMMGNMMEGQGMQMMTKDSMIMKNMIHGMMENMQNRQSMMQEMMKNGMMMGNMMKMMHEKGIMSEDCMDSGMKIMSDKGMDMAGMDKMKK